MKLLYLIFMLIVGVHFITSSSTVLLIPHRHYSLALYWITTGYKLFIMIPPECLKDAPITFSHFTVHVFVDHDPLVASVYLPDLFSKFSDSALKISPQYVTPGRPENSEAHLEGGTQGNFPRHDLEHERERQTNPRLGLGRHIFHQPFPNSTTLFDLLQSLEEEFDLDRRFIATFTIFPQDYQQDDGYPEWHDKPLPRNMSLAEIAIFDHDAMTGGQYAGVADQYAPVLHLVAETKAATLRRNVGGIGGKSFLEHILGESDPYKRGMWSRFEAFTNCYGGNTGQPEIVTRLRQWRWRSYALQYLVNQQGKLTLQEFVDEYKLQDLISKTEEFQKKKSKVKKFIWLLASQWGNWILKQNYTTDISAYEEQLKDNGVEDLVRTVLGQRKVVEQWGRSRKSQPLPEMLRKAWFDEKVSTTSIRAPATLFKLNISDELPEMPEQPRQMSSTFPQDVHQEPPETGAVQTTPFRRSDGTLSPEHARFTVKSGILSWGQLLPVYFGSTQENFTNNAGTIPEALPGGTIKQHVYTYKSAARVGNWKVRQYYSNWRAPDPWDPNGQKQPAGWVICHDDVDPMEVLEKVRAINPGEAISNGNSHIDKDVLYIGRYDWSHHWHNSRDQDFEIKFRDWADESLIPDGDERISAPDLSEIEARRQLEKLIIQIRNRLQESLFNSTDPMSEEDLILLEDLIFQLEELPHLDAATVRRTKILNPLYSIQNMKSISGNAKWRIKARSEALRERYFETLRADTTSEESLAGVKMGGYFIAMDSENFDADFVRAYKRNCEIREKESHEVIFRKGENTFGAHVSFPDTEYEFGWLVFSGKKHAEHDADELIAIVYDGTYEVFAGLYHEVEAN